MNEHTIREIARVAHEASRTARNVFLGHTIPEFDSLSDNDMDNVVETTRLSLEHLATNPNYEPQGPVNKVFVATVKALAASQNLV